MGKCTQIHTWLLGLVGLVAVLALVACEGIASSNGADGTGPGGGGPGGGGPGGGGGGNNPPGSDGGPGTTPGIPPDGGPRMVGEMFTANFLWQPITFENAIDLGHDAQPVANPEPAGAVMLDEVAGDVGLDQARAGGNSHGVGIGFIDVDNDGWDDLLVASAGPGNPSSLYRNNAGQFVNRTGPSGIGAILGNTDVYSVAAADYDMDGDLDIYIGADGRDLLLQNDGSGNFTDVTAAAGAGGPTSRQAGSASKIVSFGDYDGDGLIDLVSASSNFGGGYPNAYLLRNQGDGTFEDVTDATQVEAAATGNPCAVLWSDYDNDGDQDLWIWNDRGNERENRALLRNDDGIFEDVTDVLGVTGSHGNPMGIDGADINRDGYLDYYISNIGNNPLYAGSAAGNFTNIEDDTGVGGDYGWGLGFEDLNRDAWSDIFVGQEDNMPYLTFTHNGNEQPQFTRAGWPHINVNNSAHNVAVAFADFDHNGTIDIVTATTDGSRINLYRNITDLGTNRWLDVRIPSTPRTGARGGISARIVVKTGDVYQFRDINGGSSRASQNATGVRFGLGQWTGAEWVAALWPDGRQVVVTGVEGNQVLELPAAAP